MDILKVKTWKEREASLGEREFVKARSARILEALDKTNKRFSWDYGRLANDSEMFGTQNTWNQTLVTQKQPFSVVILLWDGLRKLADVILYIELKIK